MVLASKQNNKGCSRGSLQDLTIIHSSLVKVVIVIIKGMKVMIVQSS